MSELVTAVDYTTLPTALLPNAKAQSRVTHTHDDQFLTDTLARAIDQFERFSGRHVFAAEVLWTLTGSSFTDSRVRSVVQPIVSFSAQAGGDVSADYAAEAEGSFGGTQIWFIRGAYQAGLSFSIVTGYDDAADIPPGILDVVLKMTAYRYENREQLVPGGQMLTPNWLEHELAAYWVPRA